MNSPPRIPDLTFEAAALRGALLVGLVDEAAVARWADERLAHTDTHAAQLSDVAMSRPEQTALREALRPMADRADAAAVSAALVLWLHVALRDGDAKGVDGLRVLSDMRREGWLRQDLAEAAKSLEDRLNMARVGMAGVVAPDRDELRMALGVRQNPSFVMAFGDASERAAFVGALSRKFVRDRRAGDPAARVWAPRGESATQCCVVLNYEAWTVARREFSPLPASACVPCLIDEQFLAPVIDGESAVPLGIDGASALSYAG